MAHPVDAYLDNMLDTPVDFEALGKLGSIMGSGGMVVMDDDTFMASRCPLLHRIHPLRILRQMHALQGGPRQGAAHAHTHHQG